MGLLEINFSVVIAQPFSFGCVFGLDMELLPKIGELWRATQCTQDTVWCTIYNSIRPFYWVHSRENHNKSYERMPKTEISKKAEVFQMGYVHYRGMRTEHLLM